VAGIRLEDDLSVGDTVHIAGHTTDLTMQVSSMQIEHKDVSHAGKGSDIGVRVPEHVREHDKVFKVEA
jgi:putative protease